MAPLPHRIANLNALPPSPPRNPFPTLVPSTNPGDHHFGFGLGLGLGGSSSNNNNMNGGGGPDMALDAALARQLELWTNVDFTFDDGEVSHGGAGAFASALDALDECERKPTTGVDSHASNPFPPSASSSDPKPQPQPQPQSQTQTQMDDEPALHEFFQARVNKKRDLGRNALMDGMDRREVELGRPAQRGGGAGWWGGPGSLGVDLGQHANGHGDRASQRIDQSSQQTHQPVQSNNGYAHYPTPTSTPTLSTTSGSTAGPTQPDLLSSSFADPTALAAAQQALALASDPSFATFLAALSAAATQQQRAQTQQQEEQHHLHHQRVQQQQQQQQRERQQREAAQQQQQQQQQAEEERDRHDQLAAALQAQFRAYSAQDLKHVRSDSYTSTPSASASASAPTPSDNYPSKLNTSTPLTPIEEIAPSSSGNGSGTSTAPTPAQQRQQALLDYDEAPPGKKAKMIGPDGTMIDGVMVGDEIISLEEDKRRRNTAASARFRLKKKEREQALERKTRDVEERMQSLERENETLRRENGWLRSLVVTGVPQPLGDAAQPVPMEVQAGGKRKR